MAEPVDAPIRKDNLRGHDLQAQIDDLNAALQDWRRTRKYSQTTEERLAELTVQCARMVESWQQIEQRRSLGAGGLEERRGERGVENRLQHEAGERLRALERTIEHEWETLGGAHDEPPTEFHGQAASLAESCVTAANLALRGFVSAESRLAALEQDLQGRMAQLSRDLQSVVAELRSARQPSSPGPASAFPLESVMRIHQELRESDGAPAAAGDALNPGAVRALPSSSEPAAALTARMDSLERAVTTAAAARPAPGWPRYSVVGIVVALGGIVLLTLWMQRRVDTRLNDAAVRVAAAERQNDAIREEAARQVADARQSAVQAQVVGNVLAAPDRVRYWLTGVGPNSRAYAQVLVSRSRGMVFSASRLRPAGDGRAYQLWLLTRGGPVSAGVIAPDPAGRVTFATDVPPRLNSRLAGALVTLERAGGGSQPSQDRVLVRAE